MPPSCLRPGYARPPSRRRHPILFLIDAGLTVIVAPYPREEVVTMPMGLLGRGRSQNAPKAGAVGASDLRDRVRSVMMVGGARNRLYLLLSAERLPLIL